MGSGTFDIVWPLATAVCVKKLFSEYYYISSFFGCTKFQKAGKLIQRSVVHFPPFVDPGFPIDQKKDDQGGGVIFRVELYSSVVEHDSYATNGLEV